MSHFSSNEAFSMFGDDSDEDFTENQSFCGNPSYQQVKTDATIASSSKVALAPNQQAVKMNDAHSPQSRCLEESKGSESDTPMTNYPFCIDYWVSHTAEYVGPVEFMDGLEGIGGHRGFFASENINPGTLLLSESPYLSWNESNLHGGELQIVTFIKDLLGLRENVAQHIHDLSFLAPRVISEVPPELIEKARNCYSETIDSLLEEFPHLDITFDEFILIFLRLQCNGFSSGIYLHLCIFNHSCKPNCIKFPSRDGKSSEVRATEFIRKGEHLTICYLEPQEQSYMTRQRMLLEQFGFTCQCKICQPENSSCIPQYPGEREPQVRQLLDSIVKLEHLANDSQNPEQLILTACEYLADAEELFVETDRFITARLLKLIVSFAHAICQQNQGTATFPENALIYLKSSFKLLEIQEKYLSNDHPDFATTFNDLSTGIQLMITHAPELLNSEIDELNTFSKASKAEFTYQSKFKKIKNMYA